MNAHSDPLFSFAQSPFQIRRCLPWLSRTCSSSDTLQPQGGSSLLPFFLSDFYPREIKLENCNSFPIYLSAQLLIYLIFLRILSRLHQGWIRRLWFFPVLYSDPCSVSLTPRLLKPGWLGACALSEASPAPSYRHPSPLRQGRAPPSFRVCPTCSA